VDAPPAPGSDAAAASAAGGTVAAIGRMRVKRAAHTATPLADGTVLLAGGCTRDGCELDEQGATAEIYDPASGHFSAVGPLAMPRVSHAAGRLPDGRVLIVGGWSRSPDGRSRVVAEAEIYDPPGQRFLPAGRMTTPRGGPTLTALADGRLLIVGGQRDRDSLASAEVYDPRTGRFEAVGRLGTARMAHAAARLADGRVLISGGSRAPGEVVASAELFDPATDRFQPAGTMLVARHKHAAAPLPDGRVLIVGGSDRRDFQGRYASAELYDPGQGRFLPAAPMATARFKIPDALAPLPGGGVLVAGDGDRLERFEPSGGVFRAVAGGVGAARAFASATPLPDGTVLIVGGYDARLAVTDGAWLFR
jgi:hypothetical protein